jgi:hypothetical protein
MKLINDIETCKINELDVDKIDIFYKQPASKNEIFRSHLQCHIRS